MARNKITVGIAVYNEEANIASVLNMVFAATCGFDREVIVVSSGSVDRTDEIVASFKDVKLIKERDRLGKVSAIKRIFDSAQGDVIVMTDGDISLCKNSVEVLVAPILNENFLATTGRVVALGQKNKHMYLLSKIGCDAWHHLRLLKDRQKSFVYPTGYLYALHRSVLNRIFLDNTVIDEDGVIGLLLFKLGVRFKYVPGAEVNVLFPQNIIDFISQKIRTRVGRRQFTEFNFFSMVEREWRNSLRLVSRNRLIYYCIYYLLDLYCRLHASVAVFMNWYSVTWNVISSTKGGIQEDGVKYIGYMHRDELKNIFREIKTEWSLVSHETPGYNWNDTVIHGVVLLSTGQRAWLRVQKGTQELKEDVAWKGQVQSVNLPDSILRPSLLKHKEIDRGGDLFQVLLFEYINDVVCSTVPRLMKKDMRLNDEWIKQLKQSLDILGAVKTDRVSITPSEMQHKIQDTFGITVDVNRVIWKTIHGDLHWANITFPRVYLLDWDVWGKGPLGYDVGLLMAFAADVPCIIQILDDAFEEIFSTEGGKIAKLYALTEVYLIAQLDSDFAYLSGPVKKMADLIIDELGFEVT